MLASAPLASQVRARGCGDVSRTSEAGHSRVEKAACVADARTAGEDRMIRSFTLVAALLGALAVPHAAWAEATVLRVAKQFGVAYMQFMVMEDQKMIEKQAKAAGLSSDVMNDALLSGSVDFVSL